MKKTSTLRALVLSVLSLLICCSMLIGTTFAWFTDSVESRNNVIKPGNLDVELEYSYDGKNWNTVSEDTAIFSDEDLWEPGHTEYVYLRVSNVGTLALDYELTLDVYLEKEGTNVYGEKFYLSDFLMYGVVAEDDLGTTLASREAAVAAAIHEFKSNFDISGALEDLGLGNGWGQLVGSVKTSRGLLPVDDDPATADDESSNVTALIITMPESVSNEANYKRGTEAPYIRFGINLFATQKTYEEDSFDKNYDEDTLFPGEATGSATVTDDASSYVIELRNEASEKIGTATIMADSVADGADELKVNIDTRTEADADVTLSANELAKTFDITVEGIKDVNPEDVKIELYVGEGLSGVKLYHKDQLMNSGDYEYNSSSGYVIFTSKDFSPFTIVYSTIPEVDEEEKPEDLPKANVKYMSEYVNTDLPWENYSGVTPTPGLDAQLEAAYKFSCVDRELADESPYAEWYCDFYVKLDKDLGENEIFLGGNYGDFGWVGFHNGELTLEANTEIPLLGSVIENPWTYAMIADFVGEFICGVGDVDDALDGATFTVTLRLTDPEDETIFYDIKTIDYKFGTTVVSNAEELQDAINNGSGEIVLDGDIDLNNGGIIIP